MAENLLIRQSIRSYEISIWTLQDRFLSVLKWATMDNRGQIQDPRMVLRDDGTQELTFSIPKFYLVGNNQVDNPMWLHLKNQPLEANMHKLKVVFNKNTDSEEVFELLVVSVEHQHVSNNVMLDVKAEGLAYHELGKIGYKISLSQATYELEEEEWVKLGMVTERPMMNIQYWNDLIFKDDAGKWKSNWKYKVEMDWSSYSDSTYKDSDRIYEDEYVSSWTQDTEGNLLPKATEGFKEKQRPIEVDESNIYNITQTIAEQFGVFCRYEYEHDENYGIAIPEIDENGDSIPTRTVVYYNNYIQDKAGHIDLTFPYSTSEITRTVDNSDLITKMYVRSVDINSDTLTIMEVDANKSKEDYLLNFDYLYESQGITGEQKEEIAAYEAAMFNLNTTIMRNQERIRVLSQQLIEAEANTTVYSNALALDDEQWKEAQKRRAELTGGTDYIPIETSCTVLTDTKNGYGEYIKIHQEGVDPDTLRLWEKNDHLGREDSYSNEITARNLVFDEFNNLIRIDHLERRDKSNYVIWMQGQYSPALYYDKIEAEWAQRVKIDQAKYDKAYNEAVDLNWYIHGSRVGYAVVDGARLGDMYYPVACIGREGADGEIEPIPAYPFGADRVWSEKVDECRILANDTEWHGIEEDIDYFEELDFENSSLDLEYQTEYSYSRKAERTSAFERMMGPALREGYWQPDNYHDYGDVYQDNVTLYAQPQEDESLSPQQLETEYLQLIWDTDKYYENESSILYDSSIGGRRDQHLMINLSGHLNEIREHIDNLSFVYCNPSSIAQIKQIEAAPEGTYPNAESWIETLKNDMYRSYTIGSGCELGWVIQDTPYFGSYYTTGEYAAVVEDTLLGFNGVKTRYPVLIITGTDVLDDDTLNNLVNNTYTERVIEDGDIVTKQSTFEDFEFMPFIGVYKKEVNEEGEIETTLTRYFTIQPSDYLGQCRNVPMHNYDGNGIVRYPNDEEYEYRRAYPRLYFNTLKLKNNSSDLFISLNSSMLENLADYSVVPDDRSTGLKTLGVGYYATLKSNVLFREGSSPINLNIIYTLSNADVSIYLDALKVMEENSKPKVSYDVKLNILNPDFIKTAYSRLNQIVYINDNDLALDEVSGYISAVTMQLDKPWEDNVEIKNYETKFEDLFSTIVAQTEAMKKSSGGIDTAISAFTSGGLINGDILQSSVTDANLNYSFNQGKLTIDQNNGIWGVSNTGIVAFRGGGIFTATEKNANGEWVWNSGILPTGINASLITAGQLDTNRIKIYAGDQVRFQLNGEGLFAYKEIQYSLPLRAEGEENLITGADEDQLTRMFGITDAAIDSKQYVVFNPEGLFLVAKNGTWYRSGSIEEEGQLVPYYKRTTSEVQRVEVSWDGFKLRNWEGTEVFYADPDTGNMHLTGDIDARSFTAIGKDGGKFRVDSESLGFYDSEDNAVFTYADGKLTASSDLELGAGGKLRIAAESIILSAKAVEEDDGTLSDETLATKIESIDSAAQMLQDAIESGEIQVKAVALKGISLLEDEEAQAGRFTVTKDGIINIATEQFVLNTAAKAPQNSNDEMPNLLVLGPDNNRTSVRADGTLVLGHTWLGTNKVFMSEGFTLDMTVPENNVRNRDSIHGFLLSDEAYCFIFDDLAMRLSDTGLHLTNVKVQNSGITFNLLSGVSEVHFGSNMRVFDDYHNTQLYFIRSYTLEDGKVKTLILSDGMVLTFK